jgi:hypothetical protein
METRGDRKIGALLTTRKLALDNGKPKVRTDS